MDKSSKKSRPDDADFQARKAPDTSSPDFLGQNTDRPDEPEWHTKNLPRAQELPADSFATVNLDNAPAEDLRGNEVPSELEPRPVDLTPEPPPPATATAREGPVVTAPEQADLPPNRPIGLVDEPPTGKSPAIPETAYEKDMRRCRATPAPPVTVEQLDQAQIFGPTGRALSNGKSLHLLGGTRFKTGDIVEFNDHRFRVTVQTKRPPIYYLKVIGLIMLVFLSGYGAASFLADRPAGTIFGVVVDSTTGQVLPSAEITLPNGTTVLTSAAGIYLLPELAPGEYEVRVTKPGYRGEKKKTAIAAGRDTTLSFELDPLYTPADQEKKDKSTAKKEDDSKTAAAYGTLKLEVDFDDYLIYLDDRIYGKNVKKIAKINPGKHQITVEKNLYEDYRTKVEIKARRTTNVTLSLEMLKRKTTPRERAKTRFAAGKSALDQEQYQEAIKQFDAALAEVPEYAEALHYRGWAYRKLDNFEQAAADLQAGAELYALANHYFDAITCVNYLIKIYSRRGEYYIMRGNYRTALNELKPAIEDYNAAVDLDKKSSTFQLALAEAYFLDEQFKEAAKVFEKARKLDSDPTDVYVRLILAYMYAGKDNDLIKRYREFTAIATEERLERLERDPEWKRVLQLVRPDELR
ncbi:carboxypeptidase regulatory-like domain-containing protein [Candidatus Zixiibacteriota bacterium]